MKVSLIINVNHCHKSITNFVEAITFVPQKGIIIWKLVVKHFDYAQNKMDLISVHTLSDFDSCIPGNVQNNSQKKLSKLTIETGTRKLTGNGVEFAELFLD